MSFMAPAHPFDDKAAVAGTAGTSPVPAGTSPVPPAVPAAPAAASKPRRGRPPGSITRIDKGAGGLRGLCWWLMRQQPTFTINQLLDTYATGQEKDAHNNLQKYLAQLERCGVVQRLGRRAGDAITSPGFVVWRLVRDLGVLAPVWWRAQGALWDANSGAVVPQLDPVGPGTDHDNDTDTNQEAGHE